jgi:hypothetical protein
MQFAVATIVALIPGVAWWRVFMAPDERSRGRALRQAAFVMVIIVAVLWLVVVADLARVSSPVA